MPELDEVSLAGLAQDYEAFVERALLASSEHQLRGTRLQVGERAQVLRKAVGLAERHLAAGALLGGVPQGLCRSLLPLGECVCAGLLARPYFAACQEVMLQLVRLPAQCRDSWARHLRAPARMQPQHSECFLMDYLRRPLEGGLPCFPHAPWPPRSPARSVALAAPQRSRLPYAGSGTQGALCLEHGAPSRAQCRSLGWGIIAAATELAKKATQAPRGAQAGPSPRPVSRRVAKCSTLRPYARGRPLCLSGWDGPAQHPKPCQTRAPPVACRCAAAPRVLSTRPSPALGPDASRLPKRQTPGRANRGDPGGRVTPNDGWRGSRSPIIPAIRGWQQPGTDPFVFLRPHGGRGGTTGWGGQQTSSRPSHRGVGAAARKGSPPPLPPLAGRLRPMSSAPSQRP